MPDDPGYWEPWSPEIGQRVRVLPRPECYYCRSAEDEDGLVGVVTEVRAPSDVDDGGAAHRYWVSFPVVVESHGCDLSHFAAIELEPEEAPPASTSWQEVDHGIYERTDVAHQIQVAREFGDQVKRADGEQP